uniref:Putative 8.9 kDa family member n=1 Tax=Rhipicephalus pulchellus TaxID=72859 RepID=L7MCD2_RHIPC
MKLSLLITVFLINVLLFPDGHEGTAILKHEWNKCTYRNQDIYSGGKLFPEDCVYVACRIGQPYAAVYGCKSDYKDNYIDGELKKCCEGSNRK